MRDIEKRLDRIEERLDWHKEKIDRILSHIHKFEHCMLNIEHAIEELCSTDYEYSLEDSEEEY